MLEHLTGLRQQPRSRSTTPLSLISSLGASLGHGDVPLGHSPSADRALRHLAQACFTGRTNSRRGTSRSGITDNRSLSSSRTGITMDASRVRVGHVCGEANQVRVGTDNEADLLERASCHALEVTSEVRLKVPHELRDGVPRASMTPFSVNSRSAELPNQSLLTSLLEGRKFKSAVCD